MSNPTDAPNHITEHKLTAAQVEADCPARLQQIGNEITELLAEADKQIELAQNHLIAVKQLLVEAKELCDGGGFKKFQEMFCPQLRKSQAYALLAISAGKKTLAEHRSEERERKRRTRANQKAARPIPGQSRKSRSRRALLQWSCRPMLPASCRSKRRRRSPGARSHRRMMP